MKISTRPKVFISGVTGQDGSLLAELMLENGFEVFGGFRRGTDKFWRLSALGILEKINLIEFQLHEPNEFFSILKEHQFSHIFHLAGESFVADSYRHPIATIELNTIAVVNLLEAVRVVSPTSRVFLASSSETYGTSPISGIVNENSPRAPLNPYGVSKLAADSFVRLYRESYGLFVCSGILFNHESWLRGRQFVTRKISHNLARLKLVGGEPMRLGNLDSKKDWGSAHDYVEAMRLILAANEPTDYVIGSGVARSVRDFLTIAANSAGFVPHFQGSGVSEVCVDEITGKIIAAIDPAYFRPLESGNLAGDSSKLEQELGWVRNWSFEAVVDSMVKSDVKNWSNLSTTH